jgi:hypothetical protein
VATLKQSVDHPHFETLQTSTILHMITTTMLQSLFKATPPKRSSNFKQNLHAAISSNTLRAPIWNWHTPLYPAVLCLNPFTFVMIIAPLHLLHQHKYLLVVIKVWRGSEQDHVVPNATLHAISLSDSLFSL